MTERGTRHPIHPHPRRQPVPLPPPSSPRNRAPRRRVESRASRFISTSARAGAHPTRTRPALEPNRPRQIKSGGSPVPSNSALITSPPPVRGIYANKPVSPRRLQLSPPGHAPPLRPRSRQQPSLRVASTMLLLLAHSQSSPPPRHAAVRRTPSGAWRGTSTPQMGRDAAVSGSGDGAAAENVLEAHNFPRCLDSAADSDCGWTGPCVTRRPRAPDSRPNVLSEFPKKLKYDRL